MNQMTQKKRFVHFDERVWTGESRRRITEQSKTTIWAYKTWIFFCLFVCFFKWVIVSLDKTLIHRLEWFKALWSRTETVVLTLNRLVPIEVHYMEKNPGMFSSKTLISFPKLNKPPKLTPEPTNNQSTYSWLPITKVYTAEVNVVTVLQYQMIHNFKYSIIINNVMLSGWLCD